MTDLDDLFSQIEDLPIPGGCPRCDAYQTVESPFPGVHVLTVHHDVWCALLRSRKAEMN
jgi:hypothetical protein